MFRHPLVRLALAGLCSLLPLQVGAAGRAGAPDPIDFARDVQPILAGRCYDCHGAEKAKGGLHLTSRAAALKGGESGTPAIVAGSSARSLLIERVTTAEEDDVMPQKGERLTPGQIQILRRWIDEGAVWPENVKHWAYVKPVRPAVPRITRTDFHINNPIDSFVVARLIREGLGQSPLADKPRWLRRVSLDLVGLPPTPAEVDAFVADTDERAWERVVDRLLASPHYGERWARPWLDLARYADSHGFQRDDLRDLWPYRDWVIRAMNADMPYDQFTVWQNAGDLLPEIRAPGPGGPASLDPLIATGFHRAVATNVEAGSDQEEGRVNQVFDRVNTTAAVWLGTTLECAQCHNHKYDPFSQKEYYQLFAYFNDTPKETDFVTPKAMAALKFTGPYLSLPDPENEPKRREIEERQRRLDARIAERTREVLTEMEAWEEEAGGAVAGAGQTHALEIADFESSAGSEYRMLPDKSVLLVDDVPDRDTYTLTVRTSLVGITGFKLEALTDPSLPGSGPGRGDAARPNFILNQFRVTAAKSGAAEMPVQLVSATASYSQARFEVEKALRSEPDPRSGWAIGQQFHRDHWAVFATGQPLGDAAGLTLRFTLVQNFGTGRTIGRLRLSALTGRAGGKPVPAEIAAILREPRPARSAAQSARLREYHLAQDKGLEELKAAKQKLAQELNSLKPPQTLVMKGLEERRTTNVMKRGNFLEPGEPVEPLTPAVLHPIDPTARRTRLDFARWLVDRENPLIARVAVNRWWAEFFGRGIVGTVEDFGLKGDLPTHPELLDWLAVEFMERGWSMKRLHRLIVLSATYRQSARITPELLARDDQNLLHARGPRFRLDAETIRDNALAAADLLSLKQGGPPVRPYQPPGLWDNKVGGDRVTYEVSTGEDAWRRGIYTVWKRSSPYPSFMNFDATARTACTIRRSRSNTPLQALTLLNDPVYVAAALALARRTLVEQAGASTTARIAHAFRLCLARPPTAAEVAALQRLLEQQLAAYAGDPEVARAAGGTESPPPGVTAGEFAAWQAVATALLNLDEMITKG